MFNYKDKVCVVTGASSGMGKATAEMLVKEGAKVWALDIQNVEVHGAQYVNVDLSKKESIDNAFAKVPANVDCYFGVAGLKGATMEFIDVANINFTANKYICKEILAERMTKGGAIAIVTSAAGIGWEKEGNWKFYKAAVEAEGWDATVEAMHATRLTGSNGGMAYVYSKLAANYLVANLQGFFGPKGIRVNALMPGDTATNFGVESGTKITNESFSSFAGHAGRPATSEEMAAPLLFLNSDTASFISGSYIFADFGACGEIMGGYRPSPTGESIEANIMRAMAARAAQQQ